MELSFDLFFGYDVYAAQYALIELVFGDIERRMGEFSRSVCLPTSGSARSGKIGVNFLGPHAHQERRGAEQRGNITFNAGS